MKKHNRLLGLIVAIIVTILIYFFKDGILKLSAYGYVGLFIFNIFGSGTLFLPTPLFLTAFAAASVLNPFIVTLVSSLGSALGESTGYLAGFGSEEIIEKNIKIQKMKKWFDKFGGWTIFFLAAVPNPLFDLAGVVAGASGMKYQKFIFITWLGKLIKFGVIVYLGVNSALIFSKFI
jgi:membrane protein YqaA with SNARE-associated domain